MKLFKALPLDPTADVRIVRIGGLPVYRRLSAESQTFIARPDFGLNIVPFADGQFARTFISTPAKRLTKRCQSSTVLIDLAAKQQAANDAIPSFLADAPDGLRRIATLGLCKGNASMIERPSTDELSIEWGRRSRIMVIRAMLAQNVGTGCAFGGLGVSVLALQDRFDASLGTATMTLSLSVLSMTALGPLIAGLIARWGLRAVMSTGVVMSMVGYVALGYAPNILLALAACGLLIGPGGALFAALPPAVLAGGWCPQARGRALGIAYLPLLVTFIPLLGVGIIQRFGLTSFFLSLAALHMLLLPLMFGVIDPPAEPSGEQYAASETGVGAAQTVILGGAIFWLIALGDGILNGTAIAGSAHMLPIVEAYGASVEVGAILLSVSGAASILGSLLAGYGCDRVGPAKTLALSALGFTTAWTLIAATGWLPALTTSAFLMGLCGAAVFPPVSALVVQVFGMDALPKVLGLLGVMTLPFTVAMAPAAGLLRDVSGSYGPVFVVLIAVCSTAAVTFIAMSNYLGRKTEAGDVFPAAALNSLKST